MLKNYFKTAWRNLWKHKTFSLLNIGGLTFSLTASLIIFLWAKDELSYDRYSPNADRIYRVALTLKVPAQQDKDFAVTAPPLAPALKKDYPEIENAIRVTQSRVLIGYQNEHFYSNKIVLADPGFFELFGYPLLEGDPKTVLRETHSAVVSESMAKKYFGNDHAVGKIISFGNDTTFFKITGVAKDLPTNSHLHFDLICNLNYYKELYGPKAFDSWWNDDFYTYIILKDANQAPALNKKIAGIIDVYNGKQNREMGFTGIHFLQPLRSIHLDSNLSDELEPPGNKTALNILIAIAVFLLLVACINYINLTTATSFKRAKEIGMRKVAGAVFIQLLGQFLTESILIVLIAMAFAIGLTALVLPYFNHLAGTEITLASNISGQFILVLITAAIALGIFAGLYPSFYLSHVAPITAIKQSKDRQDKLFPLRKILVVMQFSLSILMIVATIVAIQQLHFMQTQNLGLDKEQVLAIPLRSNVEANQNEAIQKSFQNIPGIILTSISSATPGKQLGNITVLPEGVPANRIQTMNTLVVDYNFISTYKMKMAAGRAFDKNFLTDSSAFILNESAVRELGWGTPQNAIGKSFDWGLGKKGKIIGIVGDFHFNSLKKKVNPIVMHILPVRTGWYAYLSVRTSTKDIKSIIASMKNAWSTQFPNHPFDYYFVDEDYNRQYQTDQRLSRLSALFSGLTILISCLGLFGLVMVAVSQRTKEIGIRKVLGASVTGIAVLLSKDFLKLVGIAVIISSPVAWLLMHRWLQDFAYRINIGWEVFVIAAGVAILIAVATVSLRAIRAAIANPVSSLRSE